MDLDYSSVDVSPSFRVCDSLIEKDKKDTCFRTTLRQEIFSSLAKQSIQVPQSVDETIEVATKWGYAYTANFDPNAKVHEVKDHSVQQLIKQWEVSNELLPNLSTLQIHSATLGNAIVGATLASVLLACGCRYAW